MGFLDGSELCHTVLQISFSSKPPGFTRWHLTPSRRHPFLMIEVNWLCLHRHAGRAAMSQSVTLLDITLVYWATEPWENEKEEPTTGIAGGQGWCRGWHRLPVSCGLGEPGWLQPLPQHEPTPRQEEFKGSKALANADSSTAPVNAGDWTHIAHDSGWFTRGWVYYVHTKPKERGAPMLWASLSLVHHFPFPAPYLKKEISMDKVFLTAPATADNSRSIILNY